MVLRLRQAQDFEQLLEQSKSAPVVIFKHSTQCAISDQAYQEFERFVQTAGELVFGMVLVIEDREVSNMIAARLGVRHESPQVILIENGRPKWNASHWRITIEALSEAVRN